jgi:hypothetical protein
MDFSKVMNNLEGLKFGISAALTQLFCSNQFSEIFCTNKLLEFLGMDADMCK